MRVEGLEVLLSASDLMRFMSCKHATALDLRYARGEALVPADDTEDAKILQKQGDEHESRHLAKLKAEGLSVVELGEERELRAAAVATGVALSQGPDVLFQGAFSASPWGGWSDFLIRMETPSSLGAFSYEVVDTKLKRKSDPKHIMQLVLYSDLLAEIQGCEAVSKCSYLSLCRLRDFRSAATDEQSRYRRIPPRSDAERKPVH
jgi:predicted RecB family nuclease